MLQNEPPGAGIDTKSADVPASQRRVTPQELTGALSAIEARQEEAARRREEEERYLAGTITLGQSVAELGLEPTPEEIWAEVQAQRAQALPDPAPGAMPEAAVIGAALSPEARAHVPARAKSRLAGHPHRKAHGLKALGLAALACAGLVAAAALLSPSHPAHAPGTGGRPVLPFFPRQTASAGLFTVTAPDAEFYRKLNLTQGPRPQYRIVLRSFWDTPPPGRGGTSAVYPLNAVPDGCTFYRPDGSPGNDTPFGQTCVFEEAGAEASAPEWTMTRYNGRYYQRVWMRRADVARLKRGNALDLYPVPSALPPGEATPLTLAVGSHPKNCYTGSARPMFRPCFRHSPGGPVMQLPEGAKAALDAHAWEDFRTVPQQEYRPPAWDTEPGTFVCRSRGSRTAEFDASSRVEPLGAVPDGTPLHCSGFTLEQMLFLHPPAETVSQVPVDARPALDRPWTVIKFGGRVYLRGWITDRPGSSSLEDRDLAIFSDTRAPEAVNPPVQITLPLAGLVLRHHAGGTSPTPAAPGKGGEVIVANVRLDGHAWDKW